MTPADILAIARTKPLSPVVPARDDLVIWNGGRLAGRRSDTDFWGKVDRQDRVTSPHVDTPCWLWTGAKTGRGYGVSGRAFGKRAAHRVAWELVNGEIPRMPGYHGTCVLHRCDTPACVNPDHMTLGSCADNNRDMIVKGRAHKGDNRRPEMIARGARNGHAVLTDEKVIEMREMRRLGRTYKDIATAFGVSVSAAVDAVSGKTWHHIPLPGGNVGWLPKEYA